MKKITLYDVAEHCGVSPKTVSRVINSEVSVSLKTREVVLSSIKHLGYQPNKSARSLRTSRSYALGLLYDNFSPAYILDLQSGMLLAGEAAGFSAIIHPCSYDNEELLIDIGTWLEQSRVDGLVLTPPLSDHIELIKFLIEKKVPFTRISPIDQNLISSYVCSSERAAACEMTEHLIALGHRDIGFIVGNLNHFASTARLSGFKDALKKAKIPIKNHLIQQGNFSFESGEFSAKKLLNQGARPTAIFASNDYMAAGVVKVARELAIDIPRDLSITGFDDAPVSRQIWPPLTTIKQPVHLMAAQATEMLVKTILGQEKTKISTEFQCELIVRESTSTKF